MFNKASIPQNDTALKRRIRSLIGKLNDFYPVFTPKTKRDPLDELVLTILSQNTNDNLSFEGFKRLKARFPSWESVANAKPSEIEDAIAIAGLSKTKTKYIQGVLKGIAMDNRKAARVRKGSVYHLESLKKLTLEESIEYLTSFNGVGQKTAACVLAFSLNMPSFPIDTHVHRILIRQGIIPKNMPAEKAHYVMYRLTKPDDRYRFHVNLIHYGREVCHARNPECSRCVIRGTCLFYRESVNPAEK